MAALVPQQQVLGRYVDIVDIDIYSTTHLTDGRPVLPRLALDVPYGGEVLLVTAVAHHAPVYIYLCRYIYDI